MNRTQIQDESRAILMSNPGRLRWAEMLKAVGLAHLETSPNIIRGAKHLLFQDVDDVANIARGTCQLAPVADVDGAKFEPQIETARIRATSSQPVVAFVQASLRRAMLRAAADQPLISSGDRMNRQTRPKGKGRHARP